MNERLNTLPKPFWILFALVAIPLLAWADVETGDEIGFYALYLAPVGAVAWYVGSAAGFLTATLAAAAWVASDVKTSHTEFDAVIVAWDTVMRVGVLAAFALTLSRLRRAIDRERALSRIDPLTGSVNRRGFYGAVERESSRAIRSGLPLSLVYIDLDHFKAVNDRSGHHVGDEVLRAVADTIAQNIRRTDVVSRLGGDEFAILLPECDAAAADIATQKVHRLLIESMQKGGWPITFSIGLVTFLRPPNRVDDLIQKADALMTSVKKGGRNRVERETVSA